uniref:dUTPase-like domain-containing protein n=1 Tax=Gallus gallus TaxID=9031 RepID=A0A8V0YBG1_CHICK
MPCLTCDLGHRSLPLGRASPIPVSQLPIPATRGSLGIDLAAAVNVTLKNHSVQKIPTGTYGPISRDKDLGALLIGRSLAGVAGLIVLPGVIDADYIGEIMVCTYTLTPPLTITVGTRIAQLIVYKRVSTHETAQLPERGDRGFGSTQDAVVSLVRQPPGFHGKLMSRCGLSSGP